MEKLELEIYISKLVSFLSLSLCYADIIFAYIWFILLCGESECVSLHCVPFDSLIQFQMFYEFLKVIVL